MPVDNIQIGAYGHTLGGAVESLCQDGTTFWCSRGRQMTADGRLKSRSSQISADAALKPRLIPYGACEEVSTVGRCPNSERQENMHDATYLCAEERAP